MLRLKATKTSLYKLVVEYAELPPMKRCEFTKAFRSPSYWLRWGTEEGFAKAYFSAALGRALLLVIETDFDGCEVNYNCYDLRLSDLMERGMVESK